MYYLSVVNVLSIYQWLFNSWRIKEVVLIPQFFPQDVAQPRAPLVTKVHSDVWNACTHFRNSTHAQRCIIKGATASHTSRSRIHSHSISFSMAHSYEREKSAIKVWPWRAHAGARAPGTKHVKVKPVTSAQRWRYGAQSITRRHEHSGSWCHHLCVMSPRRHHGTHAGAVEGAKSGVQVTVSGSLPTGVRSRPPLY